MQCLIGSAMHQYEYKSLHKDRYNDMNGCGGVAVHDSM